MAKLPKILLIIESSRTCEREFLRGIARYGRMHGPWHFYHKPKFYLRSNSQAISVSQIKSFAPDGIIVSDVEQIDEIFALGIPTIIHTFKTNTYEQPMVMGDTEKVGAMAAEHLIGLGHNHFAFCGMGDYYWSRNRYESFRKEINKSGYDVIYHELNPRRIRAARQDELMRLTRWLTGLPKPVGLMTCADDCSQNIVEACRAVGVKIPEQVSVIGVDNDDMICELSNPALSSVSMNFEGAGYQTARLIEQLINGSDVSSKAITVEPTHIEVRASSNINAIDDVDVAAAVQFINTHVNQFIQIADVLNHVTCCQRLLHEKFKQKLGRTIHQEIKRVRIEKISELLRDTDLSITQIAMQLGYSSANHLSRYFKQEMEITPLAYRKNVNPV